jgi:hypothetical protein
VIFRHETKVFLLRFLDIFDFIINTELVSFLKVVMKIVMLLMAYITFKVSILKRFEGEILIDFREVRD